MKLIVITAVLFILSGCGDPHFQANKRVCSEAELEMVEREMAICSKTGYYASHCYDIAKIAHCSLRDDK